MTRDQFWNRVIPSRHPVIIDQIDLGRAPQLWTPSYLSNHPDASTLVSTHVFVDEQGRMDFVRKNFKFFTIPFSELIQRCSTDRHLSLIGSKEQYYFRSIGKNPRKDRSWFAVTFPRLAADLKLPDFVDEDRLFSTVFRVASPNVHLWTHFDVLDNLLIQCQGRKRIKLWPPSDDPYLYVAGSTSEVVAVDRPDLQRYPLYSGAHCTEIILEPGQVLYIPALWFHNVVSEQFSVSVNAFFHRLDPDLTDRRDLYGNRDPVPVQEADHHLRKMIDALSKLPDDFQAFYGRRFVDRLNHQLAPGDERGSP